MFNYKFNNKIFIMKITMIPVGLGWLTIVNFCQDTLQKNLINGSRLFKSLTISKNKAQNKSPSYFSVCHCKRHPKCCSITPHHLCQIRHHRIVDPCKDRAPDSEFKGCRFLRKKRY